MVKEKIMKRRFSRRQELAGIPLKFNDSVIRTSCASIPIVENGWKKGLYLFGDRGTGKTEYMCGMINKGIQSELVKSFGYVQYRFVSIPELFLSLKYSYGSGDGKHEKELIEKLTKHTDVLVLDDLGSEKISEWTESILYLIIDRRYREGQTLAVTSNFSLDELTLKVDDRLCSRIVEMCNVIHLDGVDHRLQGDLYEGA